MAAVLTDTVRRPLLPHKGQGTCTEFYTHTRKSGTQLFKFFSSPTPKLYCEMSLQMLALSSKQADKRYLS